MGSSPSRPAGSRSSNWRRTSNTHPVWAIPADLLEALHDIGPRLPELWEQGLFSSAQKKALLRSLIDKVVVHRLGGRRGDRIHVRVVWRGGATTTAPIGESPSAASRIAPAQRRWKQRSSTWPAKDKATPPLQQRSHPRGIARLVVPLFCPVPSRRFACGTVCFIARANPIHAASKSKAI